MADEKKGWLNGWTNRLSKKIEKGLEVDGYDFEVKSPIGPVLTIVVKGAEGDLKLLKNLRKQLDEFFKHEIKAELEGYEGFKHEIKAANKGDDLVLTCEIVFP